MPHDRPDILPRLLEEPFRAFFPLGVVGAVAGVLPWVWFHAGWQPVYPGYAHGLLQIQGFVMVFAVGFLMTALPRFLETTPTRPWELLLGWLLCAGVVTCLCLGLITPGELLFLGLLAHLALFAGRRLVTRGDDPPNVARDGLLELGFQAAEAQALLADAQGDTAEELLASALRGARS